ncbi:MAG: NifU family protein [Acidimicrobiia bacterium]
MTALMETLDYIRPALHADGGEVIYHGVDDEGVVQLELLGACGTCPLSIVTLVSGIERLVLQRVPGASGVVAHSPVLPELSGLGE